jgi:hypothetical protein
VEEGIVSDVAFLLQDSAFLQKPSLQAIEPTQLFVPITAPGPAVDGLLPNLHHVAQGGKAVPGASVRRPSWDPAAETSVVAGTRRVATPATDCEE